MYDVIVVGARVAGASTAMLLARQGLRVLAVDQAAFPSDTLSTHQVQTPGVARLRRWGLLQRLEAAGTPPASHLRFDAGSTVLSGNFPEIEASNAVYSPRRTLLDAMLVDAARVAGAEVREKYQVEELIVEEGRVCGIKGRTKGALSTSTDRGRFIIGADGKHSMVASAVAAPVTAETPPLTFAAYTYWQGVKLTGGEIYSRPGFSVGAWPTNGDLTMTFVSWPASTYAAHRADLESSMLRALGGAGDLGARVRAGRRAERIRGTTDTVNRIRKPYGRGWALVGDAGLVMDPISGHGISHAFLGAELLTNALVDVVTNGADEEAALARYATERDRRVRAMYDFTIQLASFAPSAAAQVLFRALAGRQAEIDRFFGVITGSIDMRTYMSPQNMIRVLGLGGFLRIVAGQMRAPRQGTALPTHASLPDRTAA